MPKYTSIGNVSWTNQDMLDSLEDFLELYAKRPIKNNERGMKAPHMFATWFLVKQLKPMHIIESGVWRGQSTWLLENAAPEGAKIISIDPKLENRVYVSPKVQYSTTDFSRQDWSWLSDEEKEQNALCFFDDHQGVRRIRECKELGFKHVIFEDNYPGHWGMYDPKAQSIKSAFRGSKGDAAFLKSVLEIYYEFPPVDPNTNGGKNARWTYRKYASVTPPPLLLRPSPNPKFKIFADEAASYTWIAYLKLK